MQSVFLFPGQGSQAVGMGHALAEAFPVAREVFDEVDDALNQKLFSLICEGPESDLTLTENTQPAIMACSIAALRVLEKETGLTTAKHAKYVAGHSLGEYAALTAAGSLTLSDTAKLLKLRGQSMQKAVPEGKGAMAAIIGPDIDVVKSIIAKHAEGEVCEIANHNAAAQIVISGTQTGVNRAIERAKEAGAKRAMLLAVSAPFHCSLMSPAAEVMQQALADVAVKTPCVPVIANVTAEPVSDPDAIRGLLVEQITGMVRWHESMELLRDEGIHRAYEIGHGKVLAGILRRTAPDVEVINIASPEDVEIASKAA